MVDRGRQTLVAVGLTVLVFGLLAGVAQLLGPGEPTGGMVVEDLGDIEQLRSQFNADSGTARLVVVLSPT